MSITVSVDPRTDKSTSSEAQQLLPAPLLDSEEPRDGDLIAPGLIAPGDYLFEFHSDGSASWLRVHAVEPGDGGTRVTYGRFSGVTVRIPADHHVWVLRASLAPVAVLRGAKTVLEANGFYQDDFFDYGQWAGGLGTPAEKCRVDAMGALNVAAGRLPDAVLEAFEPVAVAARHLADAIGFAPEDDLVSSIGGWTEHPLRKVEDVYGVLDEAVRYAEEAATERAVAA